jgi:hypothetical protein
MLGFAMTYGLMAFTLAERNVLADESGRGPSVIQAQYNRPEGYVHYRVWYTSRKMRGTWLVYTEAPNLALAEHVSAMLVQLGYDTWIEPFTP